VITLDSVNKTIKKTILNSNHPNKVWSYSDFPQFSRTSVAKAYSNLYKAKLLSRQKRGLYYRSKKTILGDSIPDVEALAIAMAKQKSTFACVSGLYGYNKLGLTTQVPNVITIACDYPMRNTDRIRFILREKPSSGTEIERIILDAIRDIHKIPDTTPDKIIFRIKKLLQSGKVNINDLGTSALKEPPSVKAVIGALGEELKMKPEILESIRLAINPNTAVYLDVKNALPYAKNWRIKPRQKKN
jgi:hypothetical protein